MVDYFTLCASSLHRIAGDVFAESRTSCLNDGIDRILHWQPNVCEIISPTQYAAKQMLHLNEAMMTHRSHSEPVFPIRLHNA